MRTNSIITLLFFAGLLTPLFSIKAQVLTLDAAINSSLSNYGSIKAKTNYTNASRASVQQSRRDYMPNFSVSAQQDYGTVNGQNGPLYGLGGLAVASSGLPLPEQNWNAAFGALYLANLNWDFFTFGRARSKIELAEAVVQRDENDLSQEQFQQEVKVASAYLNLLAAQRITVAQQRNLDRALIFRSVVVARANSSLIAGVDSVISNAEVSNARIALTKAKDMENEMANRLAVLMGVQPSEFVLDTIFVTYVPVSVYGASEEMLQSHPLLRYYQSRIDISDEQLKYYRRFYYPTFNFFSVIQTRGSGFHSNYAQDQTAYTQNYFTGINPTRSNYLLGIGMTWNITTPYRMSQQVNAQKYLSQAMKDEYELVDQQLKAQMVLANQKIENAMKNYKESFIQLDAATQAYKQKTTLYKNGLTTIVDVTQTQYMLNRAETDRDIAYCNVWQALLLKAAAAGDMDIFMNEF